MAIRISKNRFAIKPQLRARDSFDRFSRGNHSVSGLSPEQVLEELPDLEAADVSACLRFASRRLDHPIVAA